VRRGVSHSDVKSTDQLQVRRGDTRSDVKSTDGLLVRRGTSHSDVNSTAQIQVKEGCCTLILGMFITFSYILAIRFIRGDKPDIMYWPVKLVLVRWMEFLTHEVL
jgi:hypothetical protein